MAISRILLVEDEEAIRTAVHDAVNGRAIIVSVNNVTGAEGLIDELWRTFDIVVLDACVPGNAPTTLRLPNRLRGLGYTATIVGTSTEQTYRQALKGAGCDIVCHKVELIKVLDGLIKRPSSRPPAK